VSKPLGCDWSKSGSAVRFGAAVIVGRGVGADRGGGAGGAAGAGAGVAGGDAGVLIAGAGFEDAAMSIAVARVGVRCLLGTRPGLAGVRSISVERTRSADTWLSATVVPAAALAAFRPGCRAGTSGRPELRVTLATTA
jgi:hypothetical protein